jgi:hypothetical protein
MDCFRPSRNHHGGIGAREADHGNGAIAAGSERRAGVRTLRCRMKTHDCRGAISRGSTSAPPFNPILSFFSDLSWPIHHKAAGGAGAAVTELAKLEGVSRISEQIRRIGWETGEFGAVWQDVIQSFYKMARRWWNCGCCGADWLYHGSPGPTSRGWTSAPP